MMTNLSSPDALLGGGIDLSPWFTLKYALGFGLVISSLTVALWRRLLGLSKPKLTPGVYVVGGSKRPEMKATRAKFRDDSKTLILDGYRHTQGEEPFYVPSEQGPRLIIPARYMEELKSAPMDKVDFVGIIHQSRFNISGAFLCASWTREILTIMGWHSVRIQVYRLG
jgi:hypothetical protein